MATIKSYTDLSQSKKLAKILPLESADMFYSDIFIDEKHKYNFHYLETYGFKTFEDTKARESVHLGFIPCWSLAALLDIIPTMIGSIFEKNALRLRMDKSETDFNIWYENLDTGLVEEGFDIIKNNIVDACYEMIIHLHELNLL